MNEHKNTYRYWYRIDVVLRKYKANIILWNVQISNPIFLKSLYKATSTCWLNLFHCLYILFYWFTLMRLFFLFLISAIFTRMNRDRMTLWQHCCHLQLQLVNIKKYLPESFLLYSLIAFMIYLNWSLEWGAFRLSVAMYLQIWLQSRN